MKNQTKKIIDKREQKDILAEIKRLSESYTPEWNFDAENPDITSTIGIIYANQVAENIERVNGILDVYHTEFVNMLDISVQPATPAQSIVLMELSQDTIDGADVPLGTRLVADAGESLDMEPVVFETIDYIHVTNANIKNVFMTDKEDGTVVPILGKVEVPEILSNVYSDAPTEDEDAPDVQSIEDEDEFVESEIGPQVAFDRIKPFRLFGETEGIEQNAVMFYHSTLLGSDGYVFIRIEGNDKLREDILNGTHPIYYVAEGKLTPVEQVSLFSDGVTIALKMEKKHTLQKLKGGEYGMLALMHKGPLTEHAYVDSIKFSAAGEKVPCTFVGNDNQELDGKDFKPFGNILSLYQECYLGHESYFQRPGSKVTITFDLSFEDTVELLTPEEENVDLKIIKRKPRTQVSMTPSAVYAQEIQLSYYNGLGYKNLICDQETRFIFADNKAAKVSISFTCPSDWESNTVGAYEGKTIRMQVLRADNCYIRPAIHYAPRIRNLQIDFKYSDFVNPEKVYSIVGTKKRDLTPLVEKKERYPIFRTMGYDDSLYIGLDKRPVKGPISIFIQLEEGKRYEPLNCVYEYSSRDGFKPLKVIDGTANMSKSGLLVFVPPTDFYDREVEGNRRFWIRISREKAQKDGEVKETLPIIQTIRMNGIRVENTDTKREEDFYLDEITPFATFVLPYRGILSCDVWVNEFGAISEIEMKRLEELDPMRIRAEYDIQGYRTAFFVKWEETERFEIAEDRRVYQLDRLTGEIRFGDGITTEIPRVTTDVAIKVMAKVSDGEKGNVLPGRINSSLGNLLFIGEIYNPVKGYGGNDMESVDEAMQRGANIISSRKRLVSEIDYVREIKSFSNLIEQVVCVSGCDSFGRTAEGMLTIILLLKDFYEGSFSFHQTQMNCKKHILEHCELTIPAESVNICEPMYVHVSVIAWIRALKIQDSFEIQSNLEHMLDEYLNPIARAGYKGWKIGSMPTPSQLMMKINSFKQDAIIENVALLVHYIDAEGEHEMDLNEFQVKPFMVCCPGKHQIHVEI